LGFGTHLANRSTNSCGALTFSSVLPYAFWNLKLTPPSKFHRRRRYGESLDRLKLVTDHRSNPCDLYVNTKPWNTSW
jgi:hypothetical protein